jgi:hypothetical protein
VFNLETTPYLLDGLASGQVRQRLDAIEERVALLRPCVADAHSLASIVEHNVSAALEPVGGVCSAHIFDEPLDLQDYREVCAGRSVPQSWAFTLTVDVPGASRLEKLATIGHRSARMHQHLECQGGPSLYWSSKNPSGFPRWLADGASSPFAVEITALAGNGDEWFVRFPDDSIRSQQTTGLASQVAGAIVGQVQVQ